MNNAPHLNTDFDKACDEAFYEKCRKQLALTRQEEGLIAVGRIDESAATTMVNRARIDAKTASNSTNKDKKDNRLFFTMLKEMDKELAELQQKMDDLLDTLQAKYGDDVVGGMVDTYLPPEIAATLKTEEDKMQALATLMLNPDGTIKDKYKDSIEAQYVQMWREKALLEFKIAIFEPILTPEQEKQVDEIISRSSVAAADRMLAESVNEHLNERIAKASDQGFSEVSEKKITGAVLFPD